MKKTLLYIQALALTIVLLGSCRARFYTPNHHPMPLFREKGDFFANASTNLATRIDLTGGYALTDNLGLYAGYGGSTLSNTSTDSINNTKEKSKYAGNMFNMGMGYFLNRKSSEEFRFEIFGDMAIGNYRNSYSGNGPLRYLNGNFIRIGIMPNIGYTSSENDLHFGYSIRLSSIAFANDKYNDSAFWKNDLERLKRRPNYGMFEHAFTFRIGGEQLKFQAQIGLQHGLNSDEYVNAIPFINFTLLAGLCFNINLLAGK
ncbi:MAG: hypothetical protein V4613_01210 [Bacteroidota bacterium]